MGVHGVGERETKRKTCAASAWALTSSSSFAASILAAPACFAASALATAVCSANASPALSPSCERLHFGHITFWTYGKSGGATFREGQQKWALTPKELW